MPLAWKSKPEAEAQIESELAEYFKALGHPIRMRIFRMLIDRESCICGDLVDALPLAQSTVSQHLKVMKNAGLIQGTVDGPRRCYGVDPRAIERLHRYVSAL